MVAAPLPLLPGTLDLLILKALTLGSLHGLGIARRVEQLTYNAFDVKAGSLFPALHKMEEAGFVVAEWGESDSRRRARFYQLTAAGRRRLKADTALWTRASLAVSVALQST